MRPLYAVVLTGFLVWGGLLSSGCRTERSHDLDAGRKQTILSLLAQKEYRYHESQASLCSMFGKYIITEDSSATEDIGSLVKRDVASVGTTVSFVKPNGAMVFVGEGSHRKGTGVYVWAFEGMELETISGECKGKSALPVVIVGADIVRHEWNGIVPSEIAVVLGGDSGASIVTCRVAGIIWTDTTMDRWLVIGDSKLYGEIRKRKDSGSHGICVRVNPEMSAQDIEACMMKVRKSLESHKGGTVSTCESVFDESLGPLRKELEGLRLLAR